jgi:3-deoxy-D-manno-octulosonic-acid transferase
LRLGFLPKDLDLSRPIWVHAVSVGEAMAIRGLIEGLRTKFPDKRFVISTVTSTGNKIARGIAREGDFVTFLPLDFSWIAKSVLDKINPCVFIIAETEIWPNLISCLHQKDIPVVIVNGRVSDSSFNGYLMIRFLLKPVLDKVLMFCVQGDRDAQRLIRLGVSADNIQITGNMKFDIQNYAGSKTNIVDYRLKLGLSSPEELWVAGSTHSGEDKIILSVYKKLRDEFPYLRLLLAPRHPERTFEVADLIKNFDFQPLRISFLEFQTQILTSSQKVFILDTVGELINYYALAKIVFVGGSLVKIGGHNILEPAWLEKPIIFGPYMFNFRDIAELFLTNQAAILVRDREELRSKIKTLLTDPTKSQQMGKRAKELILKNSGSTKKNLELISKFIPLR